LSLRSKFFKIFAVLGKNLCVCSDISAYSEHLHHDLMHALSIRNYASRADAHAKHTHQFLTHMLSFPIFQMFILYTRSIHVYVEHAYKELMCALSIRIRNVCMH
jgi:hypothetical protein